MSGGLGSWHAGQRVYWVSPFGLAPGQVLTGRDWPGLVPVRLDAGVVVMALPANLVAVAGNGWVLVPGPVDTDYRVRPDLGLPLTEHRELHEVEIREVTEWRPAADGPAHSPGAGVR